MNKSELDDSNTIRPAVAADLERVLEIEQLSFEMPWDCASFTASLEDLFLVFEKEKILGFLIAFVCLIANRAIILKIAVDPDHRGRGVAKNLLRKALDALTEMKIGQIELDVDVAKNGAIKLYEKFGFRTVQSISMDAEEDETFFVMKLELPIERLEL
jgi:ribosomal-protein-alanine N-acetyltransferase